MNIIKKLFFRNKHLTESRKSSHQVSEQFCEIGKLVKEARINKNLSINELSRISKIPELTLNSIENNIEKTRPRYPFIRSILLKLEDCLALRKNILLNLLVKEVKPPKNDTKKFIIRRFDFINTWEGSVLYFLILLFILTFLKGYFFSNITIIEINNIEEKIHKK